MYLRTIYLWASAKKSPCQGTGPLNDTKLILKDKGVTNVHFGSIWYFADVPYSPNQFLDSDFFRKFLQQTDPSFKGGIKSDYFLVN